MADQVRRPFFARIASSQAHNTIQSSLNLADGLCRCPKSQLSFNNYILKTKIPFWSLIFNYLLLNLYPFNRDFIRNIDGFDRFGAKNEVVKIERKMS